MTVGYTDWSHLVPPVVAAALLLIGLALWRAGPRRSESSGVRPAHHR